MDGGFCSGVSYSKAQKQGNSHDGLSWGRIAGEAPIDAVPESVYNSVTSRTREDGVLDDLNSHLLSRPTAVQGQNSSRRRNKKK